MARKGKETEGQRRDRGRAWRGIAHRLRIGLTETLARVLAREHVVARARAVHLLLVRDVVDLALDRDVDRLRGVGAVVLLQLGDGDRVILALAIARGWVATAVGGPIHSSCAPPCHGLSRRGGMQRQCVERTEKDATVERWTPGSRSFDAKPTTTTELTLGGARSTAGALITDWVMVSFWSCVPGS